MRNEFVFAIALGLAGCAHERPPPQYSTLRTTSGTVTTSPPQCKSDPVPSDPERARTTPPKEIGPGVGASYPMTPYNQTWGGTHAAPPEPPSPVIAGRRRPGPAVDADRRPRPEHHLARRLRAITRS